MSFFTAIINFLTADIRATVISLIIGFVVYYLSKFYFNVWLLPPGPIPLPFVGNILLLRGTKRHATIEILEYSKTYGPVFTFWFGPKPFIIITDRDIARETLRKNDFAGRPHSYLVSLINVDPYIDVAFSDFGHLWETLRRVSHSAVRKYANSERLALLVNDVVDDTVETMFKKEGINKPFEASNYVYLTFLNIIAASAFGKRYDLDDNEFKKIKYLMSDLMHEEIASRLGYWEFLAIFRLIDRKLVKKVRFHIEEVRDILIHKYKTHCEEFNETEIRDFTDAVISAKNEALAEGKETALYLTDNNLMMIIWDLFIAGTDTSQHTFKWVLKIMAFYPEIQNKLRQEIETEIGDRMPTQEDRNRCHYTNAYISECLRFRNIVPIGLYHKAVIQSKIGDFTVPKDMGVIVHQYSILNDEKYWEKPNEFIAERFLENGKYVSPLPSAFIPFSVGRRVCLGEKLALADLFLVLVRLLQKTNGYNIALEETKFNNNLEIDETQSDTLIPRSVRIILKQ